MPLVHFRAFGLFAILMVFAAQAAAPSLRDEVNLAGAWTQGGTVPNFARNGQTITGTAPFVYQRSMTIPATWTGKNIFLDFEFVNFKAEVFINDVLVTTVLGGWMPFKVDITSKVAAGRQYALKVNVYGDQIPEIRYVRASDNRQFVYYPVGPSLNADGTWCGIIGDVYLRAYGPVGIMEAHAKTSTRTGTIAVNYVVRNFSSSSKTVTIATEARPSTGGAAEKSFVSGAITLAPGQTDTIESSSSWTSPRLWWPDDPKLYHLCSAVKENGATIDSQTVRFGFREFYIEPGKNYYRLNGVRCNLRGTSFDWGGHPTSPAAMSTAIDRLRSYNANILRVHSCPISGQMLDVCDEKGFMIIDESALYGCSCLYNGGADSTVLVRNFSACFTAWVTSQRNHPSVVIWSNDNESIVGPINTSPVGEDFFWKDLKKLALAIRAADPTRPIIFEGDGELEGTRDWETWSKHYPEGYGSEPVGSPYSWMTKVSPVKPTHFGEFIFLWGPNAAANANNRWWQGTWTRGMRYIDAADISPYTPDWAGNPTPADAQKMNVFNGFAPVALFDKGYDDLGIAPVKDGTYPSVDEGGTLVRTLVLYNDEFRDSTVTAAVTVRAGGTTYASGTRTYNLPMGFHACIACTLQVPNIGGSNMELVLSTSKAGQTKFTESKFFAVTEKGLSGSTSNAIRLSNALPAWLRSPDQPAYSLVPGMTYKYYEGTWTRLPDFSALTPVKEGATTSFSLIALRNRPNNFGLVFKGYVQPPWDGDFVFYTTSDAGSRLWIGDELVVNNDGQHTPVMSGGAISLKAGVHAITVEYFDDSLGQQLLNVMWEGRSYPWDGHSFSRIYLASSSVFRESATAIEHQMPNRKSADRVSFAGSGISLRVLAAGARTIEIFNAQGGIVAKHAGDGSMVWDLSGLAGGWYVMKVTSRDGLLMEVPFVR